MSRGRLVSRFVSGILFLLMALPCALAQSKGSPSPGGSPPSKGNNPSNTPSMPAPTTNPVPQRPNFQTLYITGKVVQEDGTPLPSGAVIERICGNRVKKEAYVSASGSFGFQIGGPQSTNDVMPDASDDTYGGFGASGNRISQPRFGAAGTDSTGPMNLMGCELKADLAGYRSSSIILDGFTPMGNLDVGTILLQPIAKVQGTTISVTDMQVPKQAKKEVERATKAVQKKNLEEAENDLKLALTTYPGYATAWYKLGMLYFVQKRNADARDAFTKAIAADSKYVNPYIQLARINGLEQKWQDVAEITDKALALDSLDFPEGYYYNSIAYLFLGKLDIAERSARKAQRLDPLHRFPKTNLLLADILEKRNDVAGSIEQLQGYLKITPPPSDAEDVRLRLQKLEESTHTLAGNQAVNP